jgi:hypothetical protein
MLTSYHLTRLVCVFCGTFETGTADRPDPADKCPWCDEDLDTVAQCRGVTSRPLPFTSDPRLLEPVTDTSIDVVNDQISDKRRRNHGHGKGTGRPKGTGKGRSYRGPRDQVDIDRDYVDRTKGKGNDSIVDLDCQVEVRL